VGGEHTSGSRRENSTSFYPPDSHFSKQVGKEAKRRIIKGENEFLIYQKK